MTHNLNLINQIRADREAGTKGPWRIINVPQCGARSQAFYQEIWNDDVSVLVSTEARRATNGVGKVNMRRIARVPELEEALIEAVEAIRSIPFNDRSTEEDEFLKKIGADDV